MNVHENDERPDNLEDGRSSETAPEKAVEESEPEYTEDSLRDAMNAANDKVAAAQAEFEAARAILLDARRERDELRNAETKWRRKQPANAGIVAYLKGQNEARLERAKRMNALKEAGIDLSLLGKSPLDVAIAQRKRVEGAPSRTPKPAALKSAGSKG